eukprot:14594678-Ditylum_brightwellii.AAC.1
MGRAKSEGNETVDRKLIKILTVYPHKEKRSSTFCMFTITRKCKGLVWAVYLAGNVYKFGQNSGRDTVGDEWSDESL